MIRKPIRRASSPQSRLFAKGRLPVGTMNKSEAAYEREVLKPALQRGEIAWYRFEAIKLRLADNCFLTVDFPVMTGDGQIEMHDVKGAKAIIQEDAKVKMKVAAAAFPFVFKYAFPVPKKNGGGWTIEEL